MHLEKIVKRKEETVSTENRSNHQRCFKKKVYLKISQNLQENICARTPFTKKETLAEVFSCAFCELLEHPEAASSLKKGVLRNFTKFTGKHLCQSLFFIKL